MRMAEKIIIKECNKYIIAVKKQMLEIDNVCIISSDECIYDIYDSRTGLILATCAINSYIKDNNTMYELFNGFNTFTQDIISQKDFLLKKFADMKMEHIQKDTPLRIYKEEFEQFLLENQP